MNMLHKNKNILIALLGAATLLGGSVCSALDSLDLSNTSSGFYTDPSFSFGKVDKKIIDLTQKLNGGLPYQTGGGYQFNQYIGIEGGYIRYPDVSTDTSVVNKTSNIEQLAAKGTVPLKNSFNFFGKLGAAEISPQIINGLNNNADNIVNSAKLLPYIGTGIGYGLNQKVDFDFQLDEMPKTSNVPAIHSATAGLSYQF